MNRKRNCLWMVVIVMACAMAMVFAGCSGKETKKEAQTEAPQKEHRLSIVTTIFAPYDFARQIVGGNADVTMLLSPGAESHSFEPTPQDIIRIQECDVFVYVGGESDKWVDKILSSMDTKNKKIIKLLDTVEAVEEETKEGMQVSEEEEEEHGHEHEEKELDEHVWTSPRNAIAITKAMTKVFGELDSKNKDAYEKNSAAYVKELENLDEQFKQVVSSGKRKTIVFGDRFPLRYFADAYGLDYYAAFNGCSTDTEASAATVAFLTDKVKKEKIPVVFQIELSNGAIAKSIAEATGAKVETFYACHTLSKDDYKAGLTYVAFMKKNVEVLKEALN